MRACVCIVFIIILHSASNIGTIYLILLQQTTAAAAALFIMCVCEWVWAAATTTTTTTCGHSHDDIIIICIQKSFVRVHVQQWVILVRSGWVVWLVGVRIEHAIC